MGAVEDLAEELTEALLLYPRTLWLFFRRIPRSERGNHERVPPFQFLIISFAIAVCMLQAINVCRTPLHLHTLAKERNLTLSHATDIDGVTPSNPQQDERPKSYILITNALDLHIILVLFVCTVIVAKVQLFLLHFFAEDATPILAELLEDSCQRNRKLHPITPFIYAAGFHILLCGGWMWAFWGIVALSPLIRIPLGVSVSIFLLDPLLIYYVIRFWFDLAWRRAVLASVSCAALSFIASYYFWGLLNAV